MTGVPHTSDRGRRGPAGLFASGLLACAVGAGCLAHHAGPLPGAPADASYAELDGVNVRYVDRGPRDGAPVVLVHGFASALDVWDAVAPALVASGHRVIALDLKGFGWTGRPQGDYSPKAQAALVFGLMDRLGVRSAAVVAHSWGASIALEMALAAPERVTRLALYSAWVYEDQIPSFFRWARTPGLGELLFALYYDERPDERIARAFYDKSLVTEPFVTLIEGALDRPGTIAAALAATRGQRYDRIEGRYREIAQPALLLWGREDVVSPLPFAERLARDLPGAELEVYPRCGHFPMIEALAASTRALVAFLAVEVSP